MLPAVCVAWQLPLPAHGSWRRHQHDTTHQSFSVLHCTALGSWSQKAGQRINNVLIKITYDALVFISDVNDVSIKITYNVLVIISAVNDMSIKITYHELVFISDANDVSIKITYNELVFISDVKRRASKVCTGLSQFKPYPGALPNIYYCPGSQDSLLVRASDL